MKRPARTQCGDKEPIRSLWEARGKAKRLTGLTGWHYTYYRCPHCGHWHVGGDGGDSARK